MRKLNAIVTASMLLCFVLHAVLGTLKLFGVYDNGSINIIGYVTLSLCGIHAVVGIFLTAVGVRAIIRSGTHYFRDNMLFWARRISALGVLVMIVFHVCTAIEIGSLPRLITRILLGVSIALHVILNVKPLLLSFGVRALRPVYANVAFFSSAILLAAIAGFIFYYVRWYVIW
ncbi:MAG: hypothetical protein IJ735_07790 [Clostridia bacterium]|nr:hypothetical protein [Clostridia bacterium]